MPRNVVRPRAVDEMGEAGVAGLAGLGGGVGVGRCWRVRILLLEAEGGCSGCWDKVGKMDAPWKWKLRELDVSAAPNIDLRMREKAGVSWPVPVAPPGLSAVGAC